MMADARVVARSRRVLLVVIAAASADAAGGGQAARRRSSCRSTRPRLDREDQWIGEGVAQIIGLGLAQHPAFVQVERARLRARPAGGLGRGRRAAGGPRTLRVDVAMFGQVVRAGDELVMQPRLLEVKAAASRSWRSSPSPCREGELLAQLVPLPATYARTLKVPLTDAEAQPHREGRLSPRAR